MHWKFLAISIILGSIGEIKLKADVDVTILAMPFAELGTGFNILNRTFGPMLLKPGFSRMQRNINYASTEFRLVSSTSEVVKLVNMKGTAFLGLTLDGGGPFSLSGLGSYLEDVGDRRDYAELVFASSVEDFEYHASDIANDLIDGCQTTANKYGMTHIITGISTGGYCFISVKFWVSSMRDKLKIELEANAALEVEKFSAGIGGSYSQLTSSMSEKANVTVRVYCSAITPTVPTNPKEALGDTERFLQRHTDQNPKGTPLFLRLTPLSAFPTCATTTGSKIRSSVQELFAEYIGKALLDVTTAYRKFVSCTNKFSLRENNTDILKKLRDQKKFLRQLLIDLDNLAKTVDDYIGSDADFQKVKDLYYKGEDLEDSVEETVWRQKTQVVCKELETAWRLENSIDEASEAAIGKPLAIPKENDYACTERNLLQGATIYYDNTKSGKTSDFQYLTENTPTRGSHPCQQRRSSTSPNYSIVVFKLENPANSISSIYVSSSSTSPFGLFGLKVLVGPWKDHLEETETNGPNLEDFAQVYEYPNDDIRKIYPSVEKNFFEKGILLGDLRDKYFRGDAKTILFSTQEPFGMIVLVGIGGTYVSPVCEFIVEGKQCLKT